MSELTMAVYTSESRGGRPALSPSQGSSTAHQDDEEDTAFHHTPEEHDPMISHQTNSVSPNNLQRQHDEEAAASRSRHSQHYGNENDPEEEDGDDIMFICRCDKPKLLVEMLQSFSRTGLSSSARKSSSGITQATAGLTQTQRRASASVPQQPMTIFCSANAMTVHSQSSNKQFQASMELPSTFFQHYQLQNVHDDNDDSTYDFTIHWHSFLQCLTVLLTTSTGGSNTAAAVPSSLTMAYHNSTELLRLEWETTLDDGNGVMATAALPGLETPETEEAAELSSAFQQSPIQARWLSASLCLKEAKTELELVPGATLVQVEFWHEQPQANNGTKKPQLHSTRRPQPCLRLLTKGHASQVAVEIPGSIEFSATAEEEKNIYSSQPRPRPRRYAHTYNLTHWRQALQPLDMAKETCISVNAKGILAIQHSLNVVDSKGGNRKNAASTAATADDIPTSAFCDFLILPMVEQLEEEDEQEDDDQPEEPENDNGDDQSDSMTTSSGIRTQSSHNRLDAEDESTQSPPSVQQIGRREVRRRRAATQEDDDDDQRGANLPIGSDDEAVEEEDAEQVLLARKRSGMLFPTLSGAVQDTPHSTMTQETAESSALRFQRRRDQRKRQRRASNERQQQHQSRSIAPHQESQSNDEDEDERSVNLLQDSPAQQQHSDYSGEEDHGSDDEERYCSSPEIVYGET
jgi:Repair protein Rad1/Rec1/Rad17